MWLQSHPPCMSKHHRSIRQSTSFHSGSVQERLYASPALCAHSPGFIDQVRKHPPTHERPVGELRHHAPQVAPVLGQQTTLRQVWVHLPVAVVVQQDVEALGHKVLYLPQEPAAPATWQHASHVIMEACSAGVPGACIPCVLRLMQHFGTGVQAAREHVQHMPA
jgi:hypothetical protein